MFTRPNRRAFLRGIGGILLALPLLEQTHGEAHAAGGKAKRFITLFSHGGKISWKNRAGQYDDQGNTYQHWDDWVPKDLTPTLGKLGDEMSTLQNYTSDLILLRSVDNMAGTLAPYGGDHRYSNVTAMTAADFEAAPDPDTCRPLGPSLDQVLAQRLAVDAPSAFPSIDLEIYGHQYGTPFFSGPGQAVSSETDPVLAFNRIFAGVSPGATPDPDLVRLRAAKKSVLDGALEGFNRFRSRVSTSDKKLLDAHADHLRTMEKQLDALNTTMSCTLPDVSNSPDVNGGNAAAELIGPLHVDIILNAMRCGLSPVATLQISDIIMPWLPNPFDTDLGHSLHHAARDVGPNGTYYAQRDDWRKTILANRQWRMGLMAKLIQGLKDSPEGNGTMLDNSIILFTSEFSTGADHSVRDLPLLLAGRAGGNWKTGKYVDYNKLAKADPNTTDYDTDASTHNVFTSILNAFGYDDAHFGNDAAYRKGPLAELS
jgi:hypothetical protein